MSSSIDLTGTKRPARGISSRRSFLSDIRIDFGPADLLARLFLKADTQLRSNGIQLSFEPVENLVQINRANRDTWRPLVPIFDTTVGGFNDDNGHCLIGRNADGKPVIAQASRLYTLLGTTLRDEVESMRLFYSDPERTRGPDESCSISCPSADKIKGRITYTGAVWFHPDYRKLGLTYVLGRIAKAYAFTKWYTDVTLTFMDERVYAAGTARRAGFPRHEWAVQMHNLPIGSPRAAMIWMTADDMVDYLQSYLDAPDTEIDKIVEQRTA